MKSLVSILIGLSTFLCSSAQAIHELTDRKNIIFAHNLTGWQNIHIDSLAFDIYYPTGAMSNKKYPVYFSLHGGSFLAATKQSVSEFSDEFADYGFAVVAPDYRIGYDDTSTCTGGDDSTALQEAVYRAMQDANACIRYVANHADSFNIDTSWIFVGGASSGATLALNAAYVTDSLAAVHYPNTVAVWGKLQNSGNNEPYNYTIKGLCPMWGGMPYWDSLINQKSAIPTILFKGGKDINVPNGVGYYLFCPYASVVRAGSGIYSVMTPLNVPCVFHYQPNAGHAAYDNLFCTQMTACFFKSLINHTPYTGYYQLYDSSCH